MKKLQHFALLSVGLLSVIWFLIRVIPKPSRATYPCQQAAYPIASGFVIWLMGVIGSVTIFKHLKNMVRQRKYTVACLLVVPCLVAGMAVLGFPIFPSAANDAPEGPNNAIGEAKGIFPGRVVWDYNPKVASWDEKNGNYWDASNTDQKGVDMMLSSSLQMITGEKGEKKAWDALFLYFNKNHKKTAIGYSPSEKILIKINMNTARKNYQEYEGFNSINATPQVVIAMLRQLVKVVKVPDSCITVLDGARFITDNIYNPIKKEFPGVKVVDAHGEQGRILVSWRENEITYAVQNDCGKGIATCVTDADYIVNMALLKGHNCAGITSCGKNHFGSINGQEHYYIRQMDRGPGVYNPIVELMGHKELGQKTLLFMVDGIYGCKDADPAPEKWKMAPFNNGWPASIFLSLDNVAIESVCWDFFHTEIGDRSYMKNSDSYLHEAALANNPPSGTVYAPNGNNIRLTSLGVHEHWDNPVSMKYSRNLGKENGIELIKINQ